MSDPTISLSELHRINRDLRALKARAEAAEAKLERVRAYIAELTNGDGAPHLWPPEQREYIARRLRECLGEKP